MAKKKSKANPLKDLLGRIATGAIPDKRETVQDCLALCFFKMLEIWITDGMNSEVCREFAFELDSLISALKNKEDSFVKGFGMMERMSLFAGLNNLTKQKEKMHHGRQEQGKEAKEG